MSFEEGPYVQMAAFCDNIIEDKSGTLSAIRIIDTLTHTESKPEPPSEMPSVPHKMKLVLMLKSGRAKGRHEVKIIPEPPSGIQEQPFPMTVHLEGGERGANLIVDFSYIFELEGLYWFHVYFDDKLLTKIPFRVKYNPVKIGSIHTAP